MSLDPPRSPRLMAITDREVLGMGDLVGAAAAALEGGLPALMLREKDLPEEDLLPLARRLRSITAKFGALFVINRRPGIARAVGADGVHLGIDGPSIAQARQQLGAQAVLGYSAHDLNEALRAFERGADYVIFSPIFETPGKTGILQPVGLEALARLVRTAPGPVVALGGINTDNLDQVARTGAAGMAAIRAVFGSGHPARAVAGLLERWDAAHRAAPAPPA